MTKNNCKINKTCDYERLVNVRFEKKGIQNIRKLTKIYNSRLLIKFKRK